MEEVPPSTDEPILLDHFLEGAIEVDVDALSDGKDVLVAAVMEHIEEAGIHSGDSTCVIPAYSLGEELVKEITHATERMAKELNVIGLMNVQFAVRNGELYVLEANPRASRTVPFVSKALGIPLARWAALVMSGKTLGEIGALEVPEAEHVSVKKPVLPFNRFPGEDTLLGPEMKSTGEVMGRDQHFGHAFAKAHAGAGEVLPTSGKVLLSLRDEDKRAALLLARGLVDLGFSLMATRGTTRFFEMNSVPCESVFKVGEGRPNIVDKVSSGEIALIVNTPLGRRSAYDEKAIRAAAVAHSVPCVTTLSGAMAVMSGIEAQPKDRAGDPSPAGRLAGAGGESLNLMKSWRTQGSWLAVIALAIPLIGSGCAYFNTFYRAKKNFNDAQKQYVSPDQRATPGQMQAYDRAIRGATKVVVEYPNSKWVDDAVLMMGRSMLGKGDYEGARIKFEELRKNFPDSPLGDQGLYYHAEAFRLNREFANALDMYDSLYFYYPNSKKGNWANLQRGKIAAQRRDYQRSAAMLEPLLRAGGDDLFQLDLHLAMADAHLALEDWPVAEKHYHWVADNAKTEELVHEAKMKEGQCMEAQDEYDKAIYLYTSAGIEPPSR